MRPTGMIIVGAILLVVFGIVPSTWSVWFIGGSIVVEICETLFWVWLSRRGGPSVGPHALIGQTGKVIRDCKPLGQVRVQGEIWRARCEPGATAGDLVQVRGVNGLELAVEPPIS